VNQDDGATPEVWWDEADSGPFCNHYNDPSDCCTPCLNCGVMCKFHNSDEACNDFIDRD
jgi:hypothetical protein